MRLKENNQGYSLVEVIICIAIMAILSGLAGVTLSAINTSKATSAKEAFDEELSALQVRVKSQSPDNAIKIVREGDRYAIYYGTCKKDDGSDFVANNPDKADKTLEKVNITYAEKVGGAASQVKEQVIKFRKSDGYVIIGSGVYRFYKNRTTRTVGRVTITKATGSHYFGE